MTIVHINQPRFMPALNYFQRMIVADVFVYLDTVKFSPESWENRNRIKGANGPQWITVPIEKGESRKSIRTTRILQSPIWRNKMRNAIQSAYGKASFFDQWFPPFDEVLSKEWTSLEYLNLAVIDLFRGAWGIQGRYEFASRLGIAPKGDEANLAICEALGATKYLSGAEGRNYADPKRWQAAGIEIEFHDYVYPKYPQLHGAFIPWMSALDLLMNCGAEGRRYLLMQTMSKRVAPAKMEMVYAHESISPASN